jgi:hypothetical protein
MKCVVKRCSTSMSSKSPIFSLKILTFMNWCALKLINQTNNTINTMIFESLTLLLIYEPVGVQSHSTFLSH